MFLLVKEFVSLSQNLKPTTCFEREPHDGTYWVHLDVFRFSARIRFCSAVLRILTLPLRKGQGQSCGHSLTVASSLKATNITVHNFCHNRGDRLKEWLFKAVRVYSNWKCECYNFCNRNCIVWVMTKLNNMAFKVGDWMNDNWFKGRLLPAWSYFNLSNVSIVYGLFTLSEGDISYKWLYIEVQYTSLILSLESTKNRIKFTCYAKVRVRIGRSSFRFYHLCQSLNLWEKNNNRFGGNAIYGITVNCRRGCWCWILFEHDDPTDTISLLSAPETAESWTNNISFSIRCSSSLSEA